MTRQTCAVTLYHPNHHLQTPTMLLPPLQQAGPRRLEAASHPPLIAGDYPPNKDAVTNFQPSLAVVLGVLAVMFSMTFILLLYAKCCHRNTPNTTTNASNRQNRHRSSVFSFSVGNSNRRSGLSKNTIESLPYFKFGALKGSKDGLECAVCLSKYEDAEILRLLPTCRHAFHIDCVDQWLATNSTCPLCRSNVAAADTFLPSRSNTSSRFVAVNGIREEVDDPNLSPDSDSINLNSNSSVNEGVELFVEREEEEAGDLDRAVRRSSSIFSIGSSFRRFFAGEVGITVSGAACRGSKALHKHNHKIVFSDVVFKNRWSNVSSSDLMFLSSAMMLSSDRFSVSARSNRDQFAAAARTIGDGEIVHSIKEEMERKRWLEQFAKRDPNMPPSCPTRALLNSTAAGQRCDGGNGGGDSPAVEERRSMSEITVFSRFRELGWGNHRGRDNPVSGGGGEEKKRMIWFPIARKTVEWFASRDEAEARRNHLQGLNFV